MEVKKMKAGKELDSLISERVFGIKPSDKYGWFGWHPRANAECDEWQEIEGVKPYSTDISAAWEVVEKMKLPFVISKAYKHDYGKGEIGYTVNWCKEVHFDLDLEEECLEHCTLGNSVWTLTAPRAICLAALLAMEDKA